MSDHRKNARYGSNRPVYKWMRKHGIQNIDPVVLETVDSVEKMFALEKEYILQYRAAGVNLLNCTDGGEGTLGFRHSAEKYKEMAEKRRRENLSPETRKRLSESSKRENLSPETRKRMSESHKGKAPAAKLTEDQVREIRKECLSNPSNIEIAKR